jgi:probable H4MPT-linked C1 transfer pathway protein
VALSADGVVQKIIQLPCPLWQGLSTFHRAVEDVQERLDVRPERHVITMTGELVDFFPERATGVRVLLEAMVERLADSLIEVYAGDSGLLDVEEAKCCTAKVASANWLASAALTANKIDEGVFIDVGSTTTDLLLLKGGRIAAQGRDDFERLRFGELVYTGVVRTPVMALGDRAPFQGEWVGLMAEHFATSADVHRLTGVLPEHADLMPTADQQGKTAIDSARRLARMIGLDFESVDMPAWRQLARYFTECQLSRLGSAAQRLLSRGLVGDQAPLVGAGVGRFLVADLAQRLGRPYVDFASFFVSQFSARPDAADCAPAAALATLALSKHHV